MPLESTQQDHQPGVRRVLIAADGSAPSMWAVEAGGALAGQLGAAMTLLHVIDTSKGFSPEFGFANGILLADLRPKAEQTLARARSHLPEATEVRLRLREGDPAQQILAEAEEWEADLVVLGTHARGALGRLLLGSTAEAVVRRARCPVMTASHQPSARLGSAVDAGATVG